MSLKEKIYNAKTPADLPGLEREVIKFWSDNKIFEESLKAREGKKKFTFYDGPPFANGLPHYGHILAMSIKDLFVRYKTMQGYYVPRRNGWDCHGLPVEYQIEKELGISGKPEIEKYGVDKFNKKARESVFKYVDVWTSVIKRIGRWMDFENTYTTLDPDYIESVWWAFSKLWEKGLVYKDYTSQPYCTRCGTSLSNFETNQGYKDNVEDPSIFIKFKKKGTSNEYFMAWTTTPWTLPANLALAVDENVEYGKYQVDDTEVWVACELAKKLFDGAEELDKKYGRELIGEEYEPLYPTSDFSENRLDGKENAYKIYPADFVTLEDGTGIVHVAPAYGEDDMVLGKKNNLPIVFSANHAGKMVTEIASGEYIKDADKNIIEDLKNRKLAWKVGNIHHTYPFCWRCDTPLIYIATSSWFIRVTQIKDQLVDLNENIAWQPNYIKNGRFGKWLEGARDWNVARQRFWGAPIPIWECKECGEIKVVSNIEELGKGKDFDPHKPQIDSIEFKCEKCGGAMKRVPEVFDCWFESGSMPYAQWHYPFENKKEFDEDFPADFIAEGLDQTRGWFYTLHVLAGAIFEEPAYYNVVVNGMILAEDGQKLSKKLRNYPEPSEVFDDLGADALRQYLYSATQIGEDYRFSKKLVSEEARKTVFPLWNSLVFYSKFMKESNNETSPEGEELDKWIKERIKETTVIVTNYMEEYDLTRASRAIKDLISDLSLWYLRLSRKRTDVNFKETLGYILKNIAILSAPFMPFISEMVFQSVKNEDDAESVHLADWPKADDVDIGVIESMASVRTLVELGHAVRAQEKIKVRQPLGALSYTIKGSNKLNESIEKILMNELNVKTVTDSSYGAKNETTNYSISIDTELSQELKQEGDEREVVRTIQALRKKAGLMPADKAEVTIINYQDNEKLDSIGEQTNTTVSVSQSAPNTSREEMTTRLWDSEVVVYLI